MVIRPTPHRSFCTRFEVATSKRRAAPASAPTAAVTSPDGSDAATPIANSTGTATRAPMASSRRPTTWTPIAAVSHVRRVTNTSAARSSASGSVSLSSDDHPSKTPSRSSPQGADVKGPPVKRSRDTVANTQAVAAVAPTAAASHSDLAPAHSSRAATRAPSAAAPMIGRAHAHPSNTAPNGATANMAATAVAATTTGSGRDSFNCGSADSRRGRSRHSSAR